MSDLTTEKDNNPNQIQKKRPKKPALMDELEEQLDLPIEEFASLIPKLDASRAIKKKQIKKKQYQKQKRDKQWMYGKNKDGLSNQVFNAIEDYFL